jgi:hypothetical protein
MERLISLEKRQMSQSVIPQQPGYSHREGTAPYNPRQSLQEVAEPELRQGALAVADAPGPAGQLGLIYP